MKRTKRLIFHFSPLEKKERNDNKLSLPNCDWITIKRPRYCARCFPVCIRYILSFFFFVVQWLYTIGHQQDGPMQQQQQKQLRKKAEARDPLWINVIIISPSSAHDPLSRGVYSKEREGVRLRWAALRPQLWYVSCPRRKIPSGDVCNVHLTWWAYLFFFSYRFCCCCRLYSPIFIFPLSLWLLVQQSL